MKFIINIIILSLFISLSFSKPEANKKAKRYDPIITGEDPSVPPKSDPTDLVDKDNLPKDTSLQAIQSNTLEAVKNIEDNKDKYPVVKDIPSQSLTGNNESLEYGNTCCKFTFGKEEILFWISNGECALKSGVETEILKADCQQATNDTQFCCEAPTNAVFVTKKTCDLIGGSIVFSVRNEKDCHLVSNANRKTNSSLESKKKFKSEKSTEKNEKLESKTNKHLKK